jgi:hypothetical protein
MPYINQYSFLSQNTWFVPFACNGCSITHDLLPYTLQNSKILPKQVKLYSYLQNMKSWPFLNHSYDYKDTTAPNFNTWLRFTIPNNGAFCPLHRTWAVLPTVMGIGMDHNQWLLHDPWLLPRRVPLSQITPIHRWLLSMINDDKKMTLDVLMCKQSIRSICLTLHFVLV